MDELSNLTENYDCCNTDDTQIQANFLSEKMGLRNVIGTMKFVIHVHVSNYIWVFNNFIAYKGAAYIRGLMVRH